ncbi:MAG: protein kinase domain-containing protein [Nannocystaceae bacterium]
MQAGSERGRPQVFPGPEALIGLQLADRYRIDEVIGVGGMGAVYRAHHVVIDKKVAVKVLSPEYSGHESDSKRFMIEAQAASRIRHPNVVDITDFGYTDDGRPYLVMEYLEGEDLESLVAHRGALPFAEALDYVEQIGAALAAAHSNGVIHRDMKPENCFLVRHDGGQQIKVLDFGIAKILDDHLETGERSLTGQGLIGTPEYIAPELVKGAAPDCRVDVYALGVVLFFLLTGEVPFSSGHYMETLTQQLLDEVPPLRPKLKDPTTPVAVDAVVVRTLSKDPDTRFQDIPAMLAALREAASPPAAVAWRPTKGLVAAVGLVVLAIVVYATLPWAQWFRPKVPLASEVIVAPVASDTGSTTSEGDTTTDATSEESTTAEATEGSATLTDDASGSTTATTASDAVSEPERTEDLPQELERSALAKQLGKVRSAIRRKCKGFGLPGMSVQVKLTVAADGSVAHVAVVGKRAGSSLGSCVNRQVRRASFTAAQSASKHRVNFRL